MRNKVPTCCVGLHSALNTGLFVVYPQSTPMQHHRQNS